MNAARRLSVDPSTATLVYRVGARTFKARFKETLGFKLLRHLSGRPRQRVDLGGLRGPVWPSGAVLSDQTLAPNLSLLRTALRRLRSDPQAWADLAGRIRVESKRVFLDFP